MEPASFEQLEASLLYCPRCQTPVRVRKRLLLILPQGTKYEYTCVHCASVCGDKIESNLPFTGSPLATRR